MNEKILKVLALLGISVNIAIAGFNANIHSLIGWTCLLGVTMIMRANKENDN